MLLFPLTQTKLEAGKMEIESIPFDPYSVCQGCVEVIGPIAAKKRLRVSSSCEIDGTGNYSDMDVLGDPNRVRQVLLNLLSNAVKFTHEGQVSLHLSVKKLENSSPKDQYLLKFVVTDTGIGMSPPQLTKIFNKYHQADSTVARHYGGTGLGLAICKTLSEAMKGRISVQSMVGKGSVFTFEIPVVAAPSVVIEPKSPVQEPAMQGMNILVAEDNKMNQKLVKAMLNRAGHTATIVDNGQLAVEELLKYHKQHFELILMDVQMPVLGGIEATKLIRSKGWSHSDLPIVGLTASYQKADLQKYLDVGMNDCVGKPLRMQALQEVVRKIQTKMFYVPTC